MLVKGNANHHDTHQQGWLLDILIPASTDSAVSTWKSDDASRIITASWLQFLCLFVWFSCLKPSLMSDNTDLKVNRIIR